MSLSWFFRVLRPTIITYAAVLHIIWAGMWPFYDQVAWTTPLNAFAKTVGNHYIGAAILAAVGFGALWHVWFRNGHREWWVHALIAPQQILLLLSAGGCLVAAFNGQYADGVPRPWAFIAADQMPSMLLAVFHTMALIWPRK